MELLQGDTVVQQVATRAAQAKRERQLVMQRARSKRYYDRKKLERVMW